MDNELSTGYDISSSIPIPTMPASFYPGKAPISAILSGAAQSAAATASAAAATGSAAAASGAGKVAASASTSASAGSSAAPSYVAATSSSAAPAAQASSGGWGSWGGWGNSNAAAADAQITPAAKSNLACGKRSAKFRN